ncbi:TrlF family AAA-like ATPase [Paenibacillus odorifer]|uniref:TrlF family AAA-like ATPase n=1 Tax=Paenibacillus odorifer TaxID=189426 RepID=UPI0020C11EBA|nr:AAA family ATPase [Paenibacillus odorifer]
MSRNDARFWRCALQVNPFSYIKYRGIEHTMTETEYNEAILEGCLRNNIKIVGLADHGNVESTERLRALLESKDIVVFPGFEISTAEKIHIICLFPEATRTNQLNRYLGKLGIIDVDNGSLPSNLSCLELAKIIEEDLKGFWFAAHITSDNGILKIGQMQHVWNSPLLKAAQIPNTIANIDPRYKNIINNKEPAYRRSTPIALINAKDVCNPHDLDREESSCLVKMTQSNFRCFKLAFQDPDSRIRLASDISENYFSVIEEIKIYGGYLDGINIKLSDHLNSVIGGRGTGKSSLIECIRYCLNITPRSRESTSSHNQTINANLGREDGRIELIISSQKQNGKRYKITRRYNQPVVLETEDGDVSNLTISDILPNIEIYGQNEIMEIINDEKAKLALLDRFLPEAAETISKQSKIIGNLRSNGSQIKSCCEQIDEIQSEILLLPKLKERLESYSDLGVEQKLKKAESLATEQQIVNSIKADLKEIKLETNQKNLVTVDRLSQSTNKDLLDKINIILGKYNQINEENVYAYNVKMDELLHEFKPIFDEWDNRERLINDELDMALKKIPDMHGKSGLELGAAYRKTVSEIARIEPLIATEKKIGESIERLYHDRRLLIEKLNKEKDKYLDNLRTAIKKINKKQLQGKVQIDLKAFHDKTSLKNYLKGMEGLGEKSILWIDEVHPFSLATFIEDIKKGKEEFYEKYRVHGLTYAKAEIICKLSSNHFMDMELLEMEHIIDIKLNVSLHGEEYKPLSQLSKGQQCTAILNLLLIDNQDPLIIDQPEDNLDNAFIAERVVDELRNSKLKRQFIFATHNANIPVFGDSELIIVMEEEERQGTIKEGKYGSIDLDTVRDAVIQTLEGGTRAFDMRKIKYSI